MPSALFIKTDDGRLVAGDAYAKKKLDEMPIGSYVLARLRRPRNTQHHRKLFALLNLIFENQTFYPTLEKMLDAIKVYAGYCETHELRDGTKVVHPDSIAFDKMDQAAFETFYAGVVTIVVEKIVPGLSREDLARELMAFAA